MIVVASPTINIDISHRHDQKARFVPSRSAEILCPTSNQCKAGGRTKLTIDTAKQPTNDKTDTKPGSLAATLTVPNMIEVRTKIMSDFDRVASLPLLLVILPSTISAQGTISNGVLAITTRIMASLVIVAKIPAVGISARRSFSIFGKRYKKDTPMMI
mmetsp:Transcript_25084/g.69194  ORF Transcript_25084/g.69194 Transcript_25084/m.69194 type:complete len:158 (-) Transcript_25084:1236-1709(-)